MRLVTVTSRETGLKVGFGIYSIYEVHEEPSKEGEPLSGCTLFVTRPEGDRIVLAELPVMESFDEVARLVTEASCTWPTSDQPKVPPKKKKPSKKKATTSQKKVAKKVVKKVAKKKK